VSPNRHYALNKIVQLGLYLERISG